jgi:1,2-diacylglycerol 3-alpha-glucosyltransferase
MRIAMFTDSYLPTRDGVVTSVLTSRQELRKLGHEVFIFAPEPLDAKDREPGVVYCRSKRFRHYQGYTIPMYPTDKSSQLIRMGAEVIHAQGLLFMGLRSLLAAKNLRIPVVVTWHTMVTDAVRWYNFTPLPDEHARRLMLLYLRSLVRRADAVIAPTNAIKEELLQMQPRIRHIEVIPTGIDIGRFSPKVDGSRMRERLGLKDKKVILSVGRIAWEKNYELMLEGFAQLVRQMPDARLVIAGEGPAKENCMRLAKEHGVSGEVVFPGFISDSELPELYAACDCFSITSKFETQGIVVMEAMASGKPVSAIRYRALAEIVDDGVNGILFDEDPSSWAQATIRALEADGAMGRNGREKSQGFSQEASARDLVAIYRYAIEAKRKRLGMEG